MLRSIACFASEWLDYRRNHLESIKALRLGEILSSRITAAEELQRTPPPGDLTATGYDQRQGTEHSLKRDTLWEALEAECRDAPDWREEDGVLGD